MGGNKRVGGGEGFKVGGSEGEGGEAVERECVVGGR